jgi:hypothetical protein
MNSTNAIHHLIPRPLVRSLAVFIALCFALAAIGHFRDIALHGWLPYRFAPLPINAFWTALAFLDLLAAGCILWRFRFGLMLGVLIMAADLAVILYAMHLFGLGGWHLEILREVQFLFFGFLLACLLFISRDTMFQPAKT